MGDFKQASETARNLFVNGGWVEWMHEGSTPAFNQSLRVTNAILGVMTKHCAKCLNLNGCWFCKSKMPEQSLHPNCHCETRDIASPAPYATAFAECSEGKIENAFLKKKKFFNSNGYDIMDDGEDMRIEYERQAVQKYASGNYELGTLNDYGQRITIAVELERRVGDSPKPFTYKTGWMVYPYGIIKCTTGATDLSLKEAL